MIRDAGPGDRRAIEAVTLAAYEQYASVLGLALWEAYRQNIVTTLADPGPAAQLVAEAGGAVVGTVLLYPAGATFDIPGREPVRLPAPEVRLLAV
ncbi:MAG TPA: GNAT family N-acetyltransferase, partial [Methylomirabilota bacterium]|nr:GNAT family N-acetyltransferase [Methylomirabilota bacterium]